jgi:hypothetical protein
MKHQQQTLWGETERARFGGWEGKGGGEEGIWKSKLRFMKSSEKRRILCTSVIGLKGRGEERTIIT